MQRIIYLEGDSVIAAVRRPAFAHDWVEYPMTAPEQVVERLQGASIAIVNKVPLPAAAVDALPDLTPIHIVNSAFAGERMEMVVEPFGE